MIRRTSACVICRVTSSRITAQLPPHAAGMECVVLRNGEYAATLRFQDVPREESRSFVDHLVPHHQVTRVMLVSGDRDAEVQHLATLVGIENVHSGTSPEEKLAIVRDEVAKGPTLFLGDGINDAPAMEAATVSVAFGHNSDITAEAADAVVLEPSLAAAAGLLAPVPGAIAQEVIDVLAVLNALRVAAPPMRLNDFGSD